MVIEKNKNFCLEFMSDINKKKRREQQIERLEKKELRGK
jgi:hypothetical protein